MLPGGVEAAVDAAVPAGVRHVGFVATNIPGQFLVTEPKGHPYGVSVTFSKVKLAPGESGSRALARRLEGQVGQGPLGLYPIPAVWVTPNSTSFYFAGLLQSEGQLPSAEIHVLRWCSREEAEQRVAASSSARGNSGNCPRRGTPGRCCGPQRGRKRRGARPQAGREHPGPPGGRRPRGGPHRDGRRRPRLGGRGAAPVLPREWVGA
jgi:hypothetical protein